MVESRVDIRVGELEPGYRALIEPIAAQELGPYRTAAIEPPEAEYFPAGGRLAVLVGCFLLGTAMLAIGGGALTAVLVLAHQGIMYILGLVAFGGIGAAGIGLWAAGVREYLGYRDAARRRVGVFLAPDALLVREAERCTLLPWSCLERATDFSAADSPTDYLSLDYRELAAGRPGARRNLRVRVPWRKRQVLRRIRRRIAAARRTA